MKSLLSVLALAFVSLMTGCGTIGTHVTSGNDETIGIFRGVRYDCRHLGDDQGGGVLIFDIPLSAVADTALLSCDLSQP